MSYTAPSGNALAFDLSSGYSAPPGDALELALGDIIPTLRVVGASATSFSSAGYYDITLSAEGSASAAFILRDQDAALSVYGAGGFSPINPDRVITFIGSSPSTFVGGGVAPADISVSGTATTSFEQAIDFAINGVGAATFSGQAISTSALRSTAICSVSFSGLFNKDVAAIVRGIGKFGPSGLAVCQTISGVFGASAFSAYAKGVTGAALSAAGESYASWGGAQVQSYQLSAQSAASAEMLCELLTQGQIQFGGSSHGAFSADFATTTVTPFNPEVDAIYVLMRERPLVSHV